MQNISVNKVLLIGIVDGIPDLRYTQTNRAVLNMRVITSETYVNRERQTMESKSSHTVVVWGQKAENLKNQLQANSRVLIEGRIRNRSYEDSNTGQKKWITEIDAQTAISLDASTQQGSYAPPAQPQQTYHHSVPPQQAGPPQTPQSAPTQYQPSPPPQQPTPAPEAPPSSVTPEDDLPF